MKTSFLIYASILLIFVYLGTMRIETDETAEVASIIPQTALLYLEQRDGAAAFKKFTSSHFGRSLESIDLAAVAQEIDVEDSSLTLIEKILDVYKTAKADPIFQKILGKKITVALMQPMNSSHQEADAIGFLRENTILILHPKNSREWLEKTQNASTGRGGASILSSSQYGTHRIYRILLGEQVLSLVILKDLAVMSQNENHVRASIDTFDGELPSLAVDPDFQEIRRQSAAPETFFFVPMKTARKFLAEMGAGLSFPYKDLLLKGLQSTTGFNGFGYIAWRNKERIEKKILIRFKKEEVRPFAMNYVETQPVKSPMLSLATEDPMIYYWSNTLNIKNFSIYIEDVAEHDPNLAGLLSTLKTITGKEVSSTFALFGQEASTIVEQGPQDVLFPFPLGLFFIRVEQEGELKEIIDKLLQAYHLPMKEEKYGSAWYRYWSRGPQDGLLPLYGFWRDLFFFGNSTVLLRRVIDTHGRKISLADIGVVREIDPGVSQKNNSVSYLNNVQLLTMVKNFLEVLGTFVAIEDREIAMKIRVVLKKIVNPLLDGAMMYKASTSRSYIADDMLSIDSITEISE